MIHAWSQQRNTILADEMGLGKTLQVREGTGDIASVSGLRHLTRMAGVIHVLQFGVDDCVSILAQTHSQTRALPGGRPTVYSP
jgi:hypothetical protein